MLSEGNQTITEQLTQQRKTCLPADTVGQYGVYM